MSHVDEGLIHAWLEDQLPPDEAARVERLVATDPAWRAAAAEARGLIAATARVIGALDSAPSAGAEIVTARTGRKRRTGVSWVRAPWMRVAAAVVLVAGISGVLFTGGSDVTVSDAPPKDAIQKESRPAAVVEAPPISAQTAPAVQSRAPQVAQARPRRDSSPPTERDARRIAMTPPPAAVVAANEVASAAKAATTGTTGTTGATAATGAADVTADARGAVGGGRGGGRGAGGRGGRAADQASALVEQGAVRNEFAKTLAVPDSVLRGCWITVDTSRRDARQADESVRRAATQANESVATESLLLRFTPPVVTDLAGARPLPVVASPPPAIQASAISGLRAAPARARIQNATAHMKDDSTLVAEWLNRDDRTTQLTFRLRGDTLRGTTNTISGGLVIAGPALVAVRALCSQ